jgi:hypothetical protein
LALFRVHVCGLCLSVSHLLLDGVLQCVGGEVPSCHKTFLDLGCTGGHSRYQCHGPCLYSDQRFTDPIFRNVVRYGLQ